MNNELIGVISSEGELKGVLEDNSFNVIVQITETGPRGPQGPPGKDGYTPQKGVDYYTDADKAEMVSAVLAALPVYEGEVESV